MRLNLFKNLHRWSELPHINSALKQIEHIVERMRRHQVT